MKIDVEAQLLRVGPLCCHVTRHFPWGKCLTVLLILLMFSLVEYLLIGFHVYVSTVMKSRHFLLSENSSVPLQHRYFFQFKK